MAKHTYRLLLLCFLLTNCIGEDIIQDFVEPELRITNPISQITISETYQFNSIFLNNVGEEEDAIIAWSSSNTDVATISSTGLLTAIAEGSTNILASVNSGDDLIETSITLTVLNDTVTDPGLITKSGTIMTTSSYILSGTFTLSEQENSTDLLLSINSDYEADTALPGLYIYLTNNPSSVANALNLGPVSVFNGAHQYTIPDTNINAYSHILYWCEPFSVKVGDAEILE